MYVLVRVRARDAPVGALLCRLEKVVSSQALHQALVVFSVRRGRVRVRKGLCPVQTGTAACMSTLLYVGVGKGGGRGRGRGGAWRSHLMFNVQRSNELMTSSLDRGNGLHLRGGWFGDASAATRTGELRRQPIKPHSVTVAAIVVCTRRAASCALHSYGQSRQGWVQARAWEHIHTHTETHRTGLGDMRDTKRGQPELVRGVQARARYSVGAWMPDAPRE
jgi:hypothetical protein